MQISTLEEAAAELTERTGRPWSASKVLDYCSQKLIPLSTQISIEEKDLKPVTGKQPNESIWKNATGYSTYAPVEPMAVWLLRAVGSATIRHPADGPQSWPVREIPVTLEQVWVKADALQKIYASWLDETRQQVEAQAKTAATPATAPVETVKERRARYLEWHTEEHRINPRGALQRVYEREAKQNPKADRANIGKDIKKARGTAKTQKQATVWISHLVQDGKRKG